MSRPALSATRSIEIIELLATFPERQFNLSDIVKATGINIASTHAILNTLSEKRRSRQGSPRRSASRSSVVPSTLPASCATNSALPCC